MGTAERFAHRRGKRNVSPERVIRAYAAALPKKINGARHPAQSAVETHGAMGYMDGDGVDHFNFPQTVWLYRGVRMRATRDFTRAAEVLSVNLLSLVLMERNFSAFRGKTSSRALFLARDFFDQCLADLPDEGWCIPLETIREWLSAAR